MGNNRLPIILFTLLIAGCSSYYDDSYKYQPLTNSGEHVEGQIIIEPVEGIDLIGKSQYVTNLIWKKTENKSVHTANLDDAINRSVAFLVEKGKWPEPVQISVEYDQRYPWFTANKSIDSFRDYWKSRTGRDMGFKVIHTIICVDPLVVLVSIGQIQYFRYTYLFTDDTDSNYKSVIPKCGFAYGTRAPFSPNPYWFSPDLGVAPKAVNMLSDTEGNIEVPWGTLVIRKQGDQWQVTAEAK